MTRIAVVGVRGGWSSERLADEVERRTGFRCLVDLSAAQLDLGGERVLHGDVDLLELDAVVVKKIGAPYAPDHLDRLQLLRFVAGRGVPVFSDPRAIARVLNRLSCTVGLRLNGIPMPPTVITEDPEVARQTVGRFGRAVLKPLFSTKARGMRVIEDGPGAAGQIAAFQAAGNQVMYIQMQVDLPGRDLGVVFLDGRYLGTYARVRDGGSWNTTTRSGGAYEPYEPRPEVIELARRAQAPFGLCFTSVDVAECPQGPLVFEVSAFGAFRGLSEAHGVDAAVAYTDHVLERIGER